MLRENGVLREVDEYAVNILKPLRMRLAVVKQHVDDKAVNLHHKAELDSRAEEPPGIHRVVAVIEHAHEHLKPDTVVFLAEPVDLLPHQGKAVMVDCLIDP